jgi:hypothetical protein
MINDVIKSVGEFALVLPICERPFAVRRVKCESFDQVVLKLTNEFISLGLGRAPTHSKRSGIFELKNPHSSSMIVGGSSAGSAILL